MKTCRHPTAGRRRRGAIAVETALLLPLMLGVAFVASDLQRLSAERAQLEQSAGSAAITIAAQQRLTKPGVDALVDLVTLGRPAQYQVTILAVRQSRRIAWGLQRGDGPACAPLGDGTSYTGPLPQELPPVPSSGTGAGGGQADNSTVTLVVVQACRATRDIRSHGGVWLPDRLQVRAVNRAVAQTIALDEPLTLESLASGLAQPAP